MRGPEPARTQRARSLRTADNDAERALWSQLKGRQLCGAKFTRQLAIGPYFADFACRESRLVIELDGSQHADSEYDRQRDAFMVAEGWSVLRFWNTDALLQREAVLDTIVAALEQRLDPAVHRRLELPEGIVLKSRVAPQALPPRAPHPYPLPVKDGERGSPTSRPPSPRKRGEGKGEGQS